MLARIFLFFSFSIVTVCSCKRENPRLDIFTISDEVESNDSLLKDEYGNEVLLKYLPEKKLYYSALYSENKLNGPIRIFDGQDYPKIIGQMKNSMPIGIWFYYNRSSGLDSVFFILNGVKKKLDKSFFIFDSIRLLSGGKYFSIKKPKTWGIVSNSNGENIGVAAPSSENLDFKANLLLLVDSFSVQNLDARFAAEYLSKNLRNAYDSLKMINEQSFLNQLGWYYQVELQAIKNEQNTYLICSLFILENKIYSLIGVSSIREPESYYLYSWLFKEMAEGFCLD